MGSFAEVRGIERVLAKYDRIEAALADSVEEISIAAALPIANEAKRLAPYKTGTLRRSIHVGGHPELTPDTRIGTDLRQYGSVTSPQTSPGSCTVYVGTSVPYAAAVEYGGSVRLSASARDALAKYGGGATGRQRPPKPYLRPAIDSTAVHEQCIRSLHRAVRAIIVRGVVE
jgi:phage gpG-like protein